MRLTKNYLRKLIIEVINEDAIKKAVDDDNYKIFQNGNSEKLVREICAVIVKFKKHEMRGDTIPSAPDSSKFMAARSGKIDVGINWNVGDDSFLVAVEIGGRLDWKINKEIQDAVEPLFKKYEEYVASHGGVMYHYRTGTNYCTAGLVCSKFKFGESSVTKLRQIIKQILGE